MFIKTFAVLSTLLMGGLYMFGGFDAYPKTVDGAPAEVMKELADLDVRELPGNPGSTAEAAGGVTPTFRLQRGENRLEWLVMSGNRVATRMIATFEPVDNGIRTRITPSVIRGDAPDAQTSPAFRSNGVTLGLFQAAIDAEITEMTTLGWEPHCNDLRDEILYGGGGLATNTGQGAQIGLQVIGQVHSLRAELIKAGCNPDKAPGAGEFQRVKSSGELATP